MMPIRIFKLASSELKKVQDKARQMHGVIREDTYNTRADFERKRDAFAFCKWMTLHYHLCGVVSSPHCSYYSVSLPPER
jgi:hypothetical protein